ncbi:hypothetical protein ACEQ8H_001504 [Pleosporales sp. CAS-2024a]
MANLNLKAKDLLGYNREQLVKYLETTDGPCGFNISGLDGLRHLTKGEKDELGRKLRSAATHYHGHRDAANPDNETLDVDHLFKLLTRVADEQDGSPARYSPRRLSESSCLTDDTLPPNTFVEVETSTRTALIDDGARPACSIEELLRILSTPTASDKAVRPWLSDDTDPNIREGELKTVFTRQFDRWWDFRKSQWYSRGIVDCEEGISAFIQASRSLHEGLGEYRTLSNASFDQMIRREWQLKRQYRQLPGEPEFKSYHKAVTTRLTPYCFARPLHLKKNPSKQTPWTNWLEYLSYEKWWLEELIADANALEEPYLHARQRLLEIRRHSSREAASNGTDSSSCSTTPEATHVQQPMAKLISQVQELEAVTDAINMTVDKFLQETERYARALRAVHSQRRRVEWIFGEACLMDAEMSQQSTIAKKTNKDKKRRRGGHEEDEPAPFSRPTKVKRHTISATFQPRRSRRLDDLRSR